MKICIYGIGAIGGLIGGRLASHGLEVSAVARGATFNTLQREGLTLIEGGTEPTTSNHQIRVAQDPADLGPQDVVVLSVKATAMPDVAARIAPLIGPDTTVLSTMNGVPWWFFHGLSSELSSIKLNTLDPQGSITQAIPHERVVGTVTHLSAANEGPGVVRHVAGNRIIIGEPTGGADTPRTQAIMAALREAGFEIEESAQIQRDIWYKLWGNMTVNPISGITGATTDKILDDDYVRNFMSRCMREASAIGAKIHIPIDTDPEERHQVTRRLGAFRTSMLQDVAAGKAVELDALVGSVLEIAQQVNVDAPNIEALMGLARLHANVRGLYPDYLRS